MTVTLDLRCGVSGDMLLGALLDWYSLDRPLEPILETISDAASVQKRTSVEVGRVERGGKEALSLTTSWEPLGYRSIKASGMLAIFEEALSVVSISDVSADRARRAMRVILEAEVKAHLKGRLQDVHLHETGTPDTLVDVIGMGLMHDRLALDGEWIHGTPVSLGKGYVETAHGRMRVPVPAVRAMIGNVPVMSGPMEGELATPTGVAGALSLVEIWMDHSEEGAGIPEGVKAVGSGAGSREYEGPFDNILTIYSGAT